MLHFTCIIWVGASNNEAFLECGVGVKLRGLRPLSNSIRLDLDLPLHLLCDVGDHSSIVKKDPSVQLPTLAYIQVISINDCQEAGSSFSAVEQGISRLEELQLEQEEKHTSQYSRSAAYRREEH